MQISKIIRALINLNSICDKNTEEHAILEYQFSEDRVGFQLQNKILVDNHWEQLAFGLG